MHILAISGSLRSGSHNTALLREAARLAPAGVEVEVCDGLAELPPYDQDAEDAGAPAAVARVRARVAAADAILFATPEYNGSIPGVLKNAVDWLSRPHRACPLGGKPVAVVGASTGAYGAMWAQADLRKVLAHAGARVLDTPAVVLPRAHERFGPDGRLTPGHEVANLERTVAALAAEAAVAIAA
jgi:chromate reductase, NAD(P)H dehydrogenase (quinone)